MLSYKKSYHLNTTALYSHLKINQEKSKQLKMCVK